jgi:hypothetical protein
VCVRNETVEKTFGLLKNCYNSVEFVEKAVGQIMGLVKKLLKTIGLLKKNLKQLFVC